jgi:hypothetical protein
MTTTFAATLDGTVGKFSASAQMADTDCEDIVAALKEQYGQVQDTNPDGSLLFSDTGVEVMRDLTLNEVLHRALGEMFLQPLMGIGHTWRVKQAPPVAAPTFTVTG